MTTSPRAVLAGCASVVSRGVRHLYLTEDPKLADVQAHEKGEKLLRAGRTVVWDDGTREWIRREIAYGPVDSCGAPTEIWHADGERIRVLRTRVTVAPSGERSERSLRPVWVGYCAAYEN